MATLRNSFGVNITDGQSLLSAEEARAAGMSALRRGYEAGRLGTEMNAALADEAAARAAGDAAAAEAAAQTQQRAGLRQRFYAPEVGRVEDIGSVGDAATWAATQVGQGVASMQDPVALAAAGQGVGTAMRAVPALRGLAAIPAAAGALGAFGLNQRQMTGEFYGNLKEDPVALQSMSPQQANSAANLYGFGAGALETVVPAVAGRALGGAALRAGANVPGVASGTLRAMGTEGLTEVAQGELGRQGVGFYNPERDTSGDMSARINEFAGGAVGGAPFGAAGAVADNAYARTANAGERVKEAAGTVIDLADTAAEKTGLKDAAKVVKGKLGEVIDLSLDKGKDVWDRLDEAGGAQGVAKAAKDKLQRLRMSADEASLLSGAMPEDLPPEQASAWMQENDAKRLELMMPRLAELADAGDERASQILDQIESGDPVAQGQGIDQGAAVLLEQNDYAQAMERAAQFKENFNGFLRTAGSVAGKAAGMAGRGAVSAAKGLAEGLTEGAKGKKNLQGFSTLDYDTWKSWRDQNHPTPTSEPGSTHAIQKAVEGRRRLAEQRGQTPRPADQEAAEASKRRATLFAELMAAEAEIAAARPTAHRVGADGTVDVVNYARSIGFEVADMTTWAAGRKGTTPTAGKMASFEALTGQIDALAADMRGVLGEGAGEVVQRLLAASDPATQPFLEFLGERVDGWQAGTAARATSRKDLGVQMAALLPQEAQQELLADGGNAAGQLVSTITQIARGRVPPAQRSALEKALGGPKVLTQLLQMVGDQTAQETLVDDAPTTQDEALAVTDDGEVDVDGGAAPAVDLEAKQAERKLGRNSAPKMYVFHGEKAQTIRNSDAASRQNRDPFAPTERMSSQEMLEARQRAAEAQLMGEDTKPVVPVRRPNLIRRGMTLTETEAEKSDVIEGESPEDRAVRIATARKVKQLEKTLGVERTPETFFRRKREELNAEEKEKGGHAVARAAERREELAALDRLEAAFKAGNEKAVKLTNEAVDRFFLNRAGEYRVEPVSAKQVMDEMKMSDAQRLSIFRDYMLQDAERSGDTAFADLARMAQKRLLDEMDGTTDGQKKVFRLTAGERRKLKVAMDRYFGEGFMVRAEQLSDRVPGQISTGELLEMARAGKKAREYAGKVAQDSGNNPTVVAAAREDIESGLINFKQREGANLLGTKDTTLAIPTQALVAWVRNNRREDVDEGGSQEQRFLRDLMDGISSLTGSGMVDGLPWVNGRDGEQQRFAGRRVPGNLALPNRKGWQYNKSRDESSDRQRGDPAVSDQDEVAKDQSRGELRDTPELEGAGDPYTDIANRSRFGVRFDGSTPERVGFKRKKPADEIAKNARAQLEAEVEDLRNRSAKDDASIGREPAMSALRQAQARAGSVFARRGKSATAPLDLAASMTNIENRLNAAERPQGSELHGGPHYAYPLAYALSTKNLNALYEAGSLNAAQASQLAKAQRRTAAAIASVNVAAHRIELAKALTNGRVKTLAEADRALNTLANAAPGVAAQAPKAQTAPAGARKLSLLSTQVHNDLSRGGFAATHDSPHKFDGKFDWRANKFKGEGAMAFGAGTYLSTDDKVHSWYKKMMTEKAGGPSPTYHVSVQAMKAQLMDWNKPFAQQSALVRRVLLKADREVGLGRQDIRAATNGDLEVYEQKLDEMTGADVYRQLTAKLGSMEKASDWLQANGVLGHEYPGSGGRAGYSPNYVIYDDSKIVTNYVHFNKQGAGGPYEAWKKIGHVLTDRQIDEARKYLDRVLGKQIRAEFQNITGYSGEWIENENLLLVSTLTNAGVLNVARHEALHAFFSKFIKANPKAVRVLSTLTDDSRVMRRLQALLKDEPAALEQLKDGEERLAYIYQFAMAGQLKLPHTPGTTLMHKVRKFLRRVFQMISDQERAVDLLYAFEHGKFNEPSAGARALAKTLDQGTWLRQGSRKFDGVMQRAAAMVMPANTILAESASPTARQMATMFFTNPGEEKAGHGAPGYLNERNQQMRRYDNLFRSAIDQLDDGQMSELMEAMQNETPTDSLSDPDVAEAKEKLHGMFERFHRYMTEEKGLRMGKINESYFPVVWDPAEVAKPEFQEMLRTKYAAQMREMAGSYNDSLEDKTSAITADDVPRMLAERIARTEGLLETQAPFREDGVLRPWFASGERRALNFIDPKDRAPFLEKDLVTTLSRYVRQGVRAAEYSSRFGRNGIVLANMLASVQKELKEVAERKLAEGEFKDKDAAEKWASRQYRDVADAAGAMEGTLGNDIGTLTRNINSWSIVYQNIRLLPLALFSNFVDPLGIIARGGEAREAFEAFVDGLKGVARGWKDMISDMPADRQKGQWEQLAEHAGVIDGAVFSHLIADEYGSVYLDGKTKRFNELMFKANGMEAWNRAMRVGATRSAVRFIERHSKLPDQHSKRWLAELGLTVKDLPMDDEGRLITSKLVLLDQNPGMSTEQAEQVIGKVHSAIVRWVEGAVLSPNAAQRPAWGSDPHFSMFWHLKQFAYSFHETMIKRALNEAKHGNVMPLGVFSWYIPAIIASDVTKGLMMGGGELPQHLQGHDLGDWMLHGVERSGVLGIGNIAVDAAQDPFGLAGPMTEQIVDIFTGPAEQNIVRALPMNSLYANALL